jgi:hypothetical protein
MFSSLLTRVLILKSSLELDDLEDMQPQVQEEELKTEPRALNSSFLCCCSSLLTSVLILNRSLELDDLEEMQFQVQREP